MTNEPLSSKINTCKIKEMTIPLKILFVAQSRTKYFPIRVSIRTAVFSNIIET